VALDRSDRVEQQRQLYAGLESLKLGRGLQLDPHTVAKGRANCLRTT
jgi:hypothetical protein